MEKKYKLIKINNFWYRVKTLKDFTLITGEIIKKGDVGGYVKSEDCLSQEGNCWVMTDATVNGRVSGNAVVKDDGFVGPNAAVIGNAVVQAWQRINYGTVTTDLLGTKDWTGALYAELRIKPENGKVILYKTVRDTDNPEIFRSWYKHSFIYEIGKEAVETDVDEDVMNCCGKGLHFTSLEFIDEDMYNTILECEIDIEDILTVQDGIIRARKCRVIRAL